MPATPLSASSRYIPPGTRRWNWLPAVAATSAPTRAEINAGIDLTGQVSAVTGFQLIAGTIDVTAFGDPFVTLAPALPAVSDCEIIFYASSDSNDVRTVLPRGTTGFLLSLPEGDVAGRRCEVWPATVSAMFLDQDTEAPAQIHVQFVITSLPSQNVTIPA